MTLSVNNGDRKSASLADDIGEENSEIFGVVVVVVLLVLAVIVAVELIVISVIGSMISVFKELKSARGSKKLSISPDVLSRKLVKVEYINSAGFSKSQAALTLTGSSINGRILRSALVSTVLVALGLFRFLGGFLSPSRQVS